MFGMSERDIKIIKMLESGSRYKDIQEEFQLTHDTIKNIYSKYQRYKNISAKYPEYQKMKEFFDYNSRIYLSLSRKGYDTINKVVGLFNTTNIEDITSIRGLGNKSITIIINKLLDAGYHLGDTALEYIGHKKSQNNIINIKNVIAHHELKDTEDHITNLLENLVYYTNYKIHICFNTIAISKEDLLFMKTNEDQVQSLILSDCFMFISKQIADLICVKDGEDISDTSIMKAIDEQLNNYIDNLFKDIKEKYESKIGDK